MEYSGLELAIQPTFVAGWQNACSDSGTKNLLGKKKNIKKLN